MSRPVIGIGTDIVEVGRIRKALERTPSMLTRVFTPAEIAYSENFKNQNARLAARFAAKEATMKALGVGVGSVDFADIELVSNESGPPSILLSGRAKQLADDLEVSELLVSISHSDNYATATVIAQ